MTEIKPITLTVKHPTGHYPVYVGHGLLTQLRQLAGISGPLAVITDSNVGPLYADRLEAALVLTMPAGEQHKTLATVAQFYDQLLAAGMDRGATIVALGGGVVGDVAGFVAATYLRGVNFVQCPTSLLAMVDASVGGKTGVDCPREKTWLVLSSSLRPSLPIWTRWPRCPRLNSPPAWPRSLSTG
jgi:shikimate kinase / 3-dehydroquinate synthase